MGQAALSPEVILPRLGPPVVETVIVEDQTFLIQKPSRSDSPLDGYIPFWADLWPAARMLAKVILRESWPPGTEAIELGCGLGLPGIVAMSRGLKVTFSDHDPCALHYAADNARLNGFDGVPTWQLDWRSPPANARYPVIFGADLIYESSHAEWLASCIRQMLAADGVAWVTDLERIPARSWHAALEAETLQFTARVVRAGEPGGRRMKGNLYHIRQVRSASEGG
ncbi:MAG: protein N-lysine methyltransferase family protein [Gemmataceae bacterium]|nr:protein N-lysine methyltransferase family protein [Gemmataceae bacterium]